MPPVFDITEARDLFKIVEWRFREYVSDREKATEDIISIIMIVNHLREWIAPEYNPRHDLEWPRADTPEKEFSRRVYEHPSFKVIRSICNGTKHAKQTRRTFTEFNNYHPDIPSGHLVDGVRIESHIQPIIDLYGEWFGGHDNSD